MTDYTRKELAAINAAWRDLAYLADCSSWSNPPRLADALRYEARERGASVAKVLMVRDALQGMTAPLSAADLFYQLSPGIATAHMFGAWVATQTGRLESLALNFKTTAAAAIAAHDAAQQRAMDAFRKGEPSAADQIAAGRVYRYGAWVEAGSPDDLRWQATANDDPERLP